MVGRPMRLQYRPEIDGLRAIAVAAVVVYHAGFTVFGQAPLPGGFFGVDVFFVISGYLITALILTEMRETGRFSLPGFYERRARRLLPALLLVLLASAAAGWQVLLPSQLIAFAKSLVASLLFVSNFYWEVTTQEYGAESGLLQPLLHTWSLAVEEQFYLLFPLLLMLIHRFARARVVWCLAGGLVASLLYAQWYSSRQPVSAFYLLPSRFWELLAGAVLACYLRLDGARATSRIPARIFTVTGLTLLVLSFLRTDNADGHPGFVTLVPVTGTVLLIAFCGGRDPVTRLLASRMFVALGLISYSVYLWHFPIFAFLRLTHITVSAPLWLAAIGLTLGLSTLSYFLVEKPCRRPRSVSLRRFATLAACVSLMLLGFSDRVVDQWGVRSRWRAVEQRYGANEFDNARLRNRSWDVLNSLAADRGFGPSTYNQPSQFEKSQLWFSDRQDSLKILVVGTSVSKDLFNALYLNGDRFPGIEVARFGLDHRLFEQHVEELFAAPNLTHADAIVLASALYHDNRKRYVELVKRLAATGKRIVVASDRPRFETWGGTTIVDWYLMGRMDEELAQRDIGEVLYEKMINGEPNAQEKRILPLLARLGVDFLDLRGLACERDRARCVALTENGFKVYYDDFHWTLEGSRYFGQRLLPSLLPR